MSRCSAFCLSTVAMFVVRRSVVIRLAKLGDRSLGSRERDASGLISSERVDQRRARGVQATERGDHVRVSRHSGAKTFAGLFDFELGEALALARRVDLFARRRDVEHRAAHVDGNLLAEITAPT